MASKLDLMSFLFDCGCFYLILISFYMIVIGFYVILTARINMTTNVRIDMTPNVRI